MKLYKDNMKYTYLLNKLFYFLIVVCVVFFATFSVCLPEFVIQSRIDGSSWMRKNAIYPLKGQKIALKVEKVPGAKIKWYQIIPDVSKMYKNANHPWKKNPYKWVGFSRKIKFMN